METVEYEMVAGDAWTVCRVSTAALSERCSILTRHINLVVKQTGKPTAGKLHGGFDAAGTGNRFTVALLRHSQRKRGDTS